VDQQALAEYRYRAVREVLEGSPIGEVAQRYGTSRQSLDAWRKRFLAEGMPGLTDRSRRPRSSPRRLSAELEALICRLRREHPRWGARRIVHELGQRGVAAPPGKATVHRVMVRNGLVRAQEQQHKRRYRRWERDAPMQLWQLDIVGGVPLASGREAKLVTGIDDHSRFVVIAAVVAIPTGRAVCEAFAAAMRRYGVPSEVLTDNGKQFTGRHMRPQPVEVLFERVCRENGISQRLTKPRSPTTTGKIERFHKTLRAELLDHVLPFASVASAQEAVDGWVHGYNHQRPHQALEMAAPASRFRPHGPSREITMPTAKDDQIAVPWLDTGVIDPPPVPVPRSAAVEFEARVPPSGTVTIVSGRQAVTLRQGLAGRVLTIWADLHSIHLLLDGHVLRTVASRLLPQDLAFLAMRGARPAGHPPAAAALQRHARAPLPAGQAVEVDRKVHRDGHVLIGGGKYQVGTGLAGTTVIIRLDGHLMHAIAQGALAGTWPCPLTADRAARLSGARAAATPLPPPPMPAGSIAARRRVHASGRIMVNNQPIKLGPRHAGKLVTVIIEDTCYRILHGEEELAIKPRRDTTPITRLYVRGKNTQRREPSSMS
jgi:transposase InsO family protein